MKTATTLDDLNHRERWNLTKRKRTLERKFGTMQPAELDQVAAMLREIQAKKNPRPFVTVTQIMVALQPYRPMSLPTLYKHIKALKIKPLGVRQSPQIYPADTAQRILARYGLAPRRLARA
jgi:hypothetical protein